MSTPSRFRTDDPLSSTKDTSVPKLALKRNPFPSSAVVVIDTDNEISNGSLFSPSVRKDAVTTFEEQFIDIDFSDSQHLKLGYLWSVPVGRDSKGFGKTAMLAFYLRKINKNYGEDLPRHQKAAAIYSEPGTDITNFKKLAALLCQALLRRDPITQSAILTDAIRTIRYKVIQLEKTPRTLFPIDLPTFETEEDFERLTDPAFVKQWKFADFHTAMKGYLIVEAELGEDIAELLSIYDDKSTYQISRWMAKNPINFLFNDTVKLLQAADFKGLYVFIGSILKVV